MTKRAIIYCRVSTPGQTSEYGNHHSLDMQESFCTAFCRGREWKIVRIAKEVRSARDSESHKLKELKKCMEAIENNEADVLVVYTISRLSRHIVHGIEIAKKIVGMGKDIFCVQEGIGYRDVSERAQFHLGLVHSQTESERISQRVRDYYLYKKELEKTQEINSTVTKRCKPVIKKGSKPVIKKGTKSVVKNKSKRTYNFRPRVCVEIV